jgi:hypothetical protein
MSCRQGGGDGGYNPTRPIWGECMRSPRVKPHRKTVEPLGFYSRMFIVVLFGFSAENTGCCLFESIVKIPRVGTEFRVSFPLLETLQRNFEPGNCLGSRSIAGWCQQLADQGPQEPLSTSPEVVHELESAHQAK